MTRPTRPPADATRGTLLAAAALELEALAAEPEAVLVPLPSALDEPVPDDFEAAVLVAAEDPVPVAVAAFVATVPVAPEAAPTV